MHICKKKCTFAAAKVNSNKHDMRKSVFALVAAITVCLFTACEPQEEPLAYWYPKKQLVEGFVSQYCGYCPAGMSAVYDFAHGDDNFVVIAHHYGFYEDNLSDGAGSAISNKLGVNGTPSATINREKTTYYSRQAAVVFSPTYLPYTKKDQFDDRAIACVDIQNSYDAASHRVTVNIHGRVSPSENPNLYLTVLIKESGMQDFQNDYSISSHQWSVYRHTDAVRVFLTDPTGNEVTINEHRFFASYTYVLDSKWVPENCSVVAFISEGFDPIINANQAPVVKGTDGGTNYKPEGLK